MASSSNSPAGSYLLLTNPLQSPGKPNGQFPLDWMEQDTSTPDGAALAIDTNQGVYQGINQNAGQYLGWTGQDTSTSGSALPTADSNQPVNQILTGQDASNSGGAVPAADANQTADQILSQYLDWAEQDTSTADGGAAPATGSSQTGNQGVGQSPAASPTAAPLLSQTASSTAMVSSSSLATTQAIPAKSYAGIYAQSAPLVSTKNGLPSYVFSNSQVTGVSLKLVWSTIEPQAGVFNWSTLDAEISQALASGKKISLAVVPNLAYPSWLFQKGVQSLQFVIQVHGQLQTINIPPPWDPIYQQAYSQMMQALSAHLHSISGAYQAVSMVKVTGMNEITAETQLPSSTSTTGGVTNSIPVWQSAGYTPTKVINAWQGFAASVNAAFPDKVLAVATAGGFPPINNLGQQVLLTDPSYVNVKDEILSTGMSLYGGRFAVDWTGLNSSNLDPTVVAAEQAGAIGGWQTNDYLGAQGTGYGSDWTQKIALTNSTYQQILDLGLNQGAGQYIEVWPYDIQQFPAAIGEAAARIAGSTTIAQGATLEISGSSASNIIFGGTQGTLQLDKPSGFTGWISGFRSSDRIDLRTIAFGSKTTLTFTPDSVNPDGALVVSDGVHTASLSLSGQFSAGNFILASDSAGGTLVTDTLVVPTSANVVAQHGQTFGAGSLFSTADPFVNEYDFWDAGTVGGYFKLNGQPLPTNQDNYVPASQLNLVWYQSGSGVDTLRVRVSDDNSTWSNWSPSFTVTAPIDNGPVITASDNTVPHNADPAARTLFSVTDPFGDNIKTYQLIDNTADPLAGYFVLNGVAQPNQQVITVTQAQLFTMTFQSDSGSADISVRAADSVEWGAWAEFHVIAPTDTGPIVTTRSVTTPAGQIFAASSLFNAMDPFGDPMSQYDVWNAGGVGGQYLLNGQALPANQDNYLSAAQFAQAVYQVGSGTDTLQFRAYEGGQWSPWSSPATMTPSSTIAGGATLELASSFTGTVTFADTTGTLKLDNSASFAGTISGYWSHDKLDLSDISAATATLAYSANQTGGVLSVTDGTHTGTLALLGQYSATTFILGADTQGGALVTLVDNGPVITASDDTVPHNANPPARTLFSVTDPFGDNIKTYQLIDNTADPLAGYFVLNGVAQPNQQVITVTQAQLFTMTFQSGSGSADISVRAADSVEWGAWAEFHVIAPVDTGPMVTTRSVTTPAGQIFAASSLFTAQDPFGDPMSQYDVWNAGGAGGQYLLNGQALPANQDNYLSAAQFAQAVYQAGSGTDTLQFRAYEGGQWSPWSSAATMTPSSTIAGGATLELASSFTGTVTFASTTGTLKLDNSASFAGTIARYSHQDRLDLSDVTAATATFAYSANQTGGVLSVTDGTHSASLAQLGQYSASAFVLAADYQGGTLVTLNSTTSTTTLAAPT
jgi:hypothetical protein